MKLTDEAWSLIVHARGEVRGKVFRMSQRTLDRITIERRMEKNPVTLYSVPIRLINTMKSGEITLEWSR